MMKRKWLLYIFIVLFIASVVFLGYRLLNTLSEEREKENAFQEQVEENIRKNREEIEESRKKAQEEFDDASKKSQIRSFNSKFDTYTGKHNGGIIELKMSDLITNNKTNQEHLIELIFDGVSYGTDSEAIRNKKNTLDTWTDYDLSFDYNDEGYIYKFIVDTLG